MIDRQNFFTHPKEIKKKGNTRTIRLSVSYCLGVLKHDASYKIDLLQKLQKHLV